jgi:uncharacterized membrane protein
MNLDEGLRYLGMADTAVKTMGPLLTIVVAWIGAYGATQVLKFPLAKVVTDPTFTWLIRTIGIAICWAFAHFLSESLSNGLELAIALAQPYVYELCIDLLQKFLPGVLPKLPFLGAASKPS